MSHYTNYAIHVQDTSDSAAIVIGSLTSCNAPIANEVRSDATGGKFYPEQIVIASQKPTITAASFDLPKVLDAFGITGRMIAQAVSKPGVALVQAKYNDNAVASGSAHRRLRFAKSFNYVRRISCSHRGDATIDFESAAIYDGTNAPVVPEGSIALPTLPATPGRWTIHQVKVNSIVINCNVQVDIDFGISADVFGCDSDLYDTHVNLNEIKPRITITSLDPEGFATSGAVPLQGLVGAHASSQITLRKRAAGTAAFVADGTAEHIQITCNGTLLVTDAHSGQSNNRAQMAYVMECCYDGTNAPLVIDTTYALA